MTAGPTNAAASGKPVIVTAAVTGSIGMPGDHPGLPISPGEIVESAVAAAEAGAAIVHVHVREPDGTPSPRTDLYAEVFDGIRARSDVLICATTGSGGGRFSDAERLAALECGPEIASLDAGSMNFGDRVFVNSPAFLALLAEATRDRGILPELECFDLGMIGNVLRLGDAGLLPGITGRWWFQFCLGVKGGAPADPFVLDAMCRLIPSGAEWSVLGVGESNQPALRAALERGGHVRTGLEDTLYVRRGEYASSNAQLVEQVAEMATGAGRPIASVAEARRILGLAETAA